MSTAAATMEPPLVLQNYLLPTQYDLDLNINHMKPNFTGVLSIPLCKNKRCAEPASTFSLKLHASNIVITKASVTVEDGNSSVDLKVSYNSQALQVSLHCDDLAMPDSATVSITFIGRINSIKTFSDITLGLFKTNYSDLVSGAANNYVLATHFQPHSAKTVFPLVEELSLRVPINLSITAAEKFKVVSNTPLASKENVPMTDQARFSFEATPPIAASTFGFVLGDLEYVEKTIDTDAQLPARVYTTLGDSRNAQYALDSIAAFLPIIRSKLNAPYPLKKIDFVALPFLSDGAMENWGMVTIVAPQLLLDECSALTERKMHLQQLVAHELIHQWVGNLVLFDSWTSLWLNESFATWLGNYIISLSGINKSNSNYDYDMDRVEELEKCLDSDCLVGEDDKLVIPSIYDYTSKVDVSNGASTSTIFDTLSYEKGIMLLHMIGHAMGDERIAEIYGPMLEGVSDVIKAYQFKAIKPLNLWTALKHHTTFDVPAFCFLWTRHAGYPIVSVTTNSKRTKLIFEQHLYLYNLTADQVLMEDEPFQVPLCLKVLTDEGQVKILNVALNDRSMDLEVPLNQFICANSRRGGYYRVIYSPEVVTESILPGIRAGKFDAPEIVALLHDYGKILGTSQSTSDHLILLAKIIEALPEIPGEADYRMWNVAIRYLDTIVDTLKHFSDYEMFGKWLADFHRKAYRKMGNWDSLLNLTPGEYSISEMEVRNQILQIGIDEPECQLLARQMFKNFTSGGMKHGFTPRELLSSIFNLTMRTSGQKEYKCILEFVKNSDNSLLSHTNAQISELQTISVSSLLFTKSEQLITKTLNFVASNIDSKLIELALVGFRYQTDKQEKIRLFNWYKLHYDQWTKRSLRQGSDWAKQIGVTVSNISRLVLCEILQFDPELIELRNKFIEQKQNFLPAHGLKNIIEAEEPNIEEKSLVGSFYADLIRVL